jgi:hypothetical protein
VRDGLIKQSARHVTFKLVYICTIPCISVCEQEAVQGDGRKYFINHSTATTQWNKPDWFDPRSLLRPQAPLPVYHPSSSIIVSVSVFLAVDALVQVDGIGNVFSPEKRG